MRASLQIFSVFKLFRFHPLMFCTLCHIQDSGFGTFRSSLITVSTLRALHDIFSHISAHESSCGRIVVRWRAAIQFYFHRNSYAFGFAWWADSFKHGSNPRTERNRRTNYSAMHSLRHSSNISRPFSSCSSVTHSGQRNLITFPYVPAPSMSNPF